MYISFNTDTPGSQGFKKWDATSIVVVRMYWHWIGIMDKVLVDVLP
jgi:hypothetical protein